MKVLMVMSHAPDPDNDTNLYEKNDLHYRNIKAADNHFSSSLYVYSIDGSSILISAGSSCFFTCFGS